IVRDAPGLPDQNLYEPPTLYPIGPPAPYPPYGTSAPAPYPAYGGDAPAPYPPYSLNATRQYGEVVFIRGLIVSWVSDEPSPGQVEVKFSDGAGKTWSLVDRYPVFYRAGTLSRNQTYPVRVDIACTVTGQRADTVTVSTALPWGIAATDGT